MSSETNNEQKNNIMSWYALIMLSSDNKRVEKQNLKLQGDNERTNKDIQGP